MSDRTMVRIDSVSNIVGEIIKPSKKIAIGGGAMFLKPMEIVREIIRQKITDLHIFERFTYIQPRQIS